MVVSGGNKPKGSIRLWEWNPKREEYELRYIHFRTLEEARKSFEGMEVCDDTPQLELIENFYDEYGCIIYEDTIELKD